MKRGGTSQSERVKITIPSFRCMLHHSWTWQFNSFPKNYYYIFTTTNQTQLWWVHFNTSLPNVQLSLVVNVPVFIFFDRICSFTFFYLHYIHCIITPYFPNQFREHRERERERDMMINGIEDEDKWLAEGIAAIQHNAFYMHRALVISFSFLFTFPHFLT